MTPKGRASVALALGVGAVVATRAWRASRAISFAGKSVAIFGGSRGLGLDIARELASEDARLTLLAHDAGELDRARIDVEERGGAVDTIACDMRDRQQVDAAIERIVGHYGAINVLINNAGIIQAGRMEHMTVADFEDAMATHFWGPLNATLAALPHMRRAKTGRIVNISSIGGKIAVPHLVAYSASNFALNGLSEGLCAELAKEGIRVTTVCDSIPGFSIDARRAALQVIDACRHGDPELVITLPARVAVLINATFPGIMAEALAIASSLLPPPSPFIGCAPTKREDHSVRSPLPRESA